MDPRATVLALSCLACLAAACGERARSEPSTSAPTASANGGSRAAASPNAASSTSASAAMGASSAAGTTSAGASASAAASAAPSSSARAATTGAGANDCKLVRGPVKLAATGAVAIGPGEGGLLAFAVNKTGAPVWEMPRFPEPTKPGSTSLVPRATAPTPLVPNPLAPSPQPASASAATSASTGAPAASGTAAPEERTRLPACALAAGLTFCVDTEGQIHRRPVQGGDDKVIAKGRRGTPVSAVALGGHTVYAFLANQKTTEGVIVRAFVSFDDETPIPLSEEGSGATYVALVARDDDVLAMYIDARTALTPVHARTLKVEGATLTRGKDAVVLVGGGSDTIVRGAVGRAASGPAFVFAPMSRDGAEYGLSAVAVSGEPKDDMDAKWSLYPAPLTSPPIAATTGATPLRLARVRPESKDEGAPSVLELGHVEADGTFTDRCVIAKGAGFSDVSIAVDERDNLWLAYTSSKGTWVEQRGPGGK